MCSDQGNALSFRKKCWSIKEEFFGDFRDFCRDVGIHIYHTFCETKAFLLNAPLDLRTLWFTSVWKKEEPIAFLRIFETVRELVNNRVNRSTGLPPEKVQNGDFRRFYKKIR